MSPPHPPHPHPLVPLFSTDDWEVGRSGTGPDGPPGLSPHPTFGCVSPSGGGPLPLICCDAEPAHAPAHQHHRHGPPAPLSQSHSSMCTGPDGLAAAGGGGPAVAQPVRQGQHPRAPRRDGAVPHQQDAPVPLPPSEAGLRGPRDGAGVPPRPSPDAALSPQTPGVRTCGLTPTVCRHALVHWRVGANGPQTRHSGPETCETPALVEQDLKTAPGPTQRLSVMLRWIPLPPRRHTHKLPDVMRSLICRRVDSTCAESYTGIHLPMSTPWLQLPPPPPPHTHVLEAPHPSPVNTLPGPHTQNWPRPTGHTVIQNPH